MEIYAMVWAADYLGWWLLLWLLISGLFGWLLLKEESVAIFGRMLLAAQNGQTPFAAMWDSGRTMLAGVLLIFPGVISDAIALILLLLPNRSEQPGRSSYRDDGVIEGEGRIVEAEQIEIRPDSAKSKH